jgi:hypothetical protein
MPGAKAPRIQFVHRRAKALRLIPKPAAVASWRAFNRGFYDAIRFSYKFTKLINLTRHLLRAFDIEGGGLGVGGF